VIREVAARLPCLPFQQTNRLRILVACARPATRENANPPYRTITEPLFNNIQQSGLPIEMDIIRPGTWRALKSHLRRSREEGVRYDVVHFDLHGTISREKKYVTVTNYSSYSVGQSSFSVRPGTEKIQSKQAISRRKFVVRISQWQF